MTVHTNAGKEWHSDKAHGDVATAIDTIALGTGTGSEDDNTTALASELYRSDRSNANVEFVETDPTGGREAHITVQGGTEVPADAKISEMAVIAGGTGGDGTVIFVDEFGDITVEAGHQERFTMPYDYE
jgi:hypothetical protein